MSFKCDACGVAQPPKTKPIMFVPEVNRRPKVYEGHNDEGQRVTVGTGWEAEVEFKVCGECAGLPAPQAQPVVSLTLLRSVLHSKNANVVHVRGCKKLLDDCPRCVRIVKDLNEYGLLDLNVITEEPKAREVGVSVGSSVVDAMLRRTEHQTKRAAADFAAAYPLLKKYEQAGGGI